MKYAAQKNNTITYISSDNALDRYCDAKWDIFRINDDGSHTIIASDGKWIEKKPSLDMHGESSSSVPAGLEAQVRQMGADLDYISMMTGVSL